jgi:uncharacterized protein (TIGR03790 family)
MRRIPASNEKRTLIQHRDVVVSFVLKRLEGEHMGKQMRKSLIRKWCFEVMAHVSIIALLFVFIPRAWAQSAENVLLVLNESSAISLDIGQYYAQKRGIPAANILKLKTKAEESVTRNDFAQQIEAPIASWLARNSAQDKILYIILTKGIPLRVEGTSGADGTVASVDSELTLLYRKMTGQPIQPNGRINNPYFLGEGAISEAKPFTHEMRDIYLISRLDGYTPEDIRGLIDRGFSPSREGKILLDAKSSTLDKGGDLWLNQAAERLNAMGFKDRVVLDTTAKVLRDQTGGLGYYSWGSNDPAIKERHFNLKFVPGALAGMFVSSDGRSFKEPPPDWKLGTWEDKNSHFAGSPQSMAGDLIREGITGIAGHVAEPYLEATIRPNILFPAYLSGFNLIESYYLAMPYLSWQTVVVGDPLCAPFRSRNLSSAEIDPGLDPETELPMFFSALRLPIVSVTAFQQSGVRPDIVKMILMAESRLIRGNQDGARQTLEEVTARNDRLASSQLLLAGLYEQAEDYDKAIARYQRLLELAPNNALILNNLAYALAVRKNMVKEALPLAQKAYDLAKTNANVADTLAWIVHLSGDDSRAAVLLEEAIKTGTPNAEVHLHSAIVNTALGRMPAAEAALKKALELDPKMADREEVKALLEKMKM